MTRERHKTLAEYREEMMQKIDMGTTCPCCWRYIKRYRRRFNSGMAYSLIWLVRHQSQYMDEEGFVDCPAYAPRRVVCSREFDKLKQFFCVESKPSDDPKRRESGHWKPTEEGIAFARDASRLPAYMIVLRGVVEGFSSEEQTIREALGTRFDYEELMSERT